MVDPNISRLEQQIRDLTRKQAMEYQSDVGKYIRGHLKRKADSQGNLYNATMAAGNRDVKPYAWRVGIPAYLNKSEAKYWRLIEQGSAGLYAGGKGFRGTPLKFRGDGPGRPFRSFTKEQQAKLRVPVTAALTDRGIAQRPFRARVVYVRNEIQPMNAYREVWRQGGWRKRTRQEFRDVVGRNFLK